jgi:hypothetical protein
MFGSRQRLQPLLRAFVGIRKLLSMGKRAYRAGERLMSSLEQVTQRRI